MKLPKLKLNIPKPKLPKTNIPFRKIGSYILSATTMIAVAIGSIGLAITLINPMNLLWELTPLRTPFFTIGYTSSVEYLEFIQLYYWYSLGISSALIVFAYAIHIRSLGQLWRGIKATPRALLYSPITLYKEAKLFRDWFLDKIEKLDKESKKWHTTFKILASPYNALLKLGFNPQMAAGLLIAGGTASTAVAVNEIVVERSFSNQSPGIYAAPSEFPSEDLEKRYAWRKDNPDENTLRVVLSTVDVEKIDISGINLGGSYASNGEVSQVPTNATSVLNISGNNTRIEIGKLVFSRNTCKTLDIYDVNANKVTVKDNQADGLSIYQSVTSTQPNFRHSIGYYGADLLETTGGTYDMLVIMPDTSMTSSKARVNELNLTNIVSRGAGTNYACVLSKLDIGELEVTFNRIGGDGSLTSKAMKLSSTLRSASWIVQDNLEIAMQEVPVQPR